MREVLWALIEAESKEWRRNLAMMKTRGFWTVQVVWFAAGFGFYRLLPRRRISIDWVNDSLNLVLMAAILLPIYWSLVLTLAKLINYWTDKYLKR